jgi:prepilin-type N-terminal cleavage/methylation domain-containing protein
VRPAQRERGFTLVELMMSLVIFSVAVAGILSVAVSLTQGFREQRLAVAAQDAVRSPIDLLSDALRQASPGVSDPNNVHDNTTCTSGAITVTNSTTGADALDIIFASGGIVTSITANTVTESGGTVTLAHTTNLAVGDYVLLTSDYATGRVMLATTGTTATTLVLASSSCTGTNFPAFSFGVGTTVIRVQHARFTVADDAANNNMPTLWMDADSTGTVHSNEPLAEGIEDLQVALGIDAGTNGIDEQVGASTAADDWIYNHASDVLPATPMIRAVRLTLIARTTSGEFGNQFTYTRPTSEDRTSASTPDQYRRRVLRSVVEVRNVTGSP